MDKQLPDVQYVGICAVFEVDGIKIALTEEQRGLIKQAAYAAKSYLDAENVDKLTEISMAVANAVQLPTHEQALSLLGAVYYLCEEAKAKKEAADKAG